LSTKAIAKNTLFLYFRMFLTVGVSLYTSRDLLRLEKNKCKKKNKLKKARGKVKSSIARRYV